MRCLSVLVAAVLGACLIVPLVSSQAPFSCAPNFTFEEIALFDIDNCNAATDLLQNAAIPLYSELFSTRNGDASIILYLGVMLTGSWFDATAPFHDTALGVYSRFDRVPTANRTIRNMNLALIYATRPFYRFAYPSRHAHIDKHIFTDRGLDPEDPRRTDPTHPIGIGHLAGTAVVEGRRNDGFNGGGDFGGSREFAFDPFKDTTRYEPANTAYRLRYPSRWQPAQQRVNKGGIYKIQQFVTPQYGVTQPWSYADPNELEPVPRPTASNIWNRGAYKAQADDVIQAGVQLTEEQKLQAELFDDKGASLGLVVAVQGGINNYSLIEYVQHDFQSQVAMFDSGIFIWNEKRRYDAVRPFSAINEIYGDETIEAYGGPGVGTANITASEWRAYMPEADHPEYPSASTCFCHSLAQSIRRSQGGSDSFIGAFLPLFVYPPGSSLREPGVTPAETKILNFPTWSEFEAACGQSRVWAGVHFQAAVDASAEACPKFGDFAADFVESHIAGTCGAVREPAEPTRTPRWYNDERRFRRRGQH